MRKSGFTTALFVLMSILIFVLSGLGFAQKDSYSNITALREDTRVKFTYKVQRMTGPTCQIALESFVSSSGRIPDLYTCYLVARRDQQKFISKLVSDVRAKGWFPTVAEEVPTGYGVSYLVYAFIGSKGTLSITHVEFENAQYLMTVALLR